jgi:hypothetical protein
VRKTAAALSFQRRRADFYLDRDIVLRRVSRNTRLAVGSRRDQRLASMFRWAEVVMVTAAAATVAGAAVLVTAPRS